MGDLPDPARPHRVAVLVSGGQSGVDRATLDLVAELGPAVGVTGAGWCPRNGWAEDLPEPPGLLARYPWLRETPGADPEERTVRNVTDSDATLVVSPAAATSEGTGLAVRTARALGRPLLICDGRDPAAVEAWLRGLPAARLNVAGPRASEWAKGYDVTRLLLRDVLLGPPHEDSDGSRRPSARRAPGP